ncbi:MAG: hypothetical protein MJB14_17875, partial [Spirochaetes bacterium]|nr:hypothetical protein [Spirochaetota bacterium]
MNKVKTKQLAEQIFLPNKQSVFGKLVMLNYKFNRLNAFLKERIKATEKWQPYQQKHDAYMEIYQK